MQDNKKVMYKKVKGLRGVPRSFAIKCGLQHSHGLETVTHTVAEVVKIIERYLRECGVAGRPYLTGSVTTGMAVYARVGDGGMASSGHEPEVVYSGEKNPLYNPSMTDEQVSEFLFGLGSFLGAALGQTKVHLAYKDYKWGLQREEPVGLEEEAV